MSSLLDMGFGKPRRRWWVRTLIGLVAVGFVGMLAAVIGVVVILAIWSEDLPDHSTLAAYEPPVLTRIHAADGSVIGVFAKQHRVFTPIDEIPDLVKQAFISAEDKNFYSHNGVDFVSLSKAMIRNAYNVFAGRNLQGASTITQQVAKNMLLTSDKTIRRKVREGLLSRRLEAALSKDRILELYLNEIFLGIRFYGVSAASVAYFGKTLDEITLHEIAFLAALPKGPNNYHPVRNYDRAVARRGYVLSRMAEDGVVAIDDAKEAARLPLRTVLHDAPNLQQGSVWGIILSRKSVATSLTVWAQEAFTRGGLRSGQRFTGSCRCVRRQRFGVLLSDLIAPAAMSVRWHVSRRSRGWPSPNGEKRSAPSRHHAM